MQKIIITGCSRGLGKALAEHYLSIGRQVFGIARGRPDGCLSEKLQQHLLDLSDAATLKNWLAQGELEKFIQDAQAVVLINNAGTVAPNAVLGMQEPAEIIRSVSLNITAPLLLSNYLMAVKPAGACLKIVHISSGAGRNAYEGWSVYGATKAALDHHVRCVAAEGHANVAVASIAPGVIDTDMQAEIRASAQTAFPMQGQFQALKQDGRLSTPADTAARIAAMIDDARFGVETLDDVRNRT